MTAPDKHGYSERLKVSVTKMGELEFKKQVKAVQLDPYICTCTSCMLAYTHTQMGIQCNMMLMQCRHSDPEVFKVPALAHCLVFNLEVPARQMQFLPVVSPPSKSLQPRR